MKCETLLYLRKKYEHFPQMFISIFCEKACLNFELTFFSFQKRTKIKAIKIIDKFNFCNKIKNNFFIIFKIFFG